MSPLLYKDCVVDSDQTDMTDQPKPCLDGISITSVILSFLEKFTFFSFFKNSVVVP